MEIHAEHSRKKSTIIIDTNQFIGINNETFQKFVQDSINKGSKNISVDLSNVKYISSLGIGGLVHAYTTCTNRKIKFDIEKVDKNVMNVLHQVKLDTLFHIV